MFDPEVTFTELRENLEFLREAGLHGTSPPACLFNGMRLYPGTPAREKYVQMLSLPSHHLASIEPEFVDARVAGFYRLTQEYFHTFQDCITNAVVLLQDLWRSDERKAETAPGRQQLAALIIELQHEPYLFFDEALTAHEQAVVWSGISLRDLRHMPWHDRAFSLLRKAIAAIGDQSSADPGDIDRPQRPAPSAPATDGRDSGGTLVIRRGETTYLITDRGTPVRLNDTASFIWTRMAAGLQFSEVKQAYSEKFDIDLAQAELDVRGFAERVGRLGC